MSTRLLSVRARYCTSHAVACLSTFSERFLLNCKQSSRTNLISCRSLKIDRTTFRTEWKSAFIDILAKCHLVNNKLPDKDLLYLYSLMVFLFLKLTRACLPFIVALFRVVLTQLSFYCVMIQDSWSEKN